MNIRLQQCTECEKQFFPFRYLCSACGARDFTYEEVDGGITEEATQLSNGVRIVSVRASDVLMVGSTLAEIEQGTRVSIQSEGSRPDMEASTVFIPSAPSPLNQEEK